MYFIIFRLRVNEPGPGPTSITCSPVILPHCRTIRAVRRSSIKKFCDNCFRALNLYILMMSRVVGSGGKRLPDDGRTISALYLNTRDAISVFCYKNEKKNVIN